MAKYVYPAVFTHEAEGAIPSPSRICRTAPPRRKRWRRELKWRRMRFA